MNSKEIAVLIPCYNEEQTITDVISSFKKYIPNSTIYVYDNNSTDKTTEVAKKAGAIVRFEPLKGKGNVVRRMFADIEADIYLLVDGDSTYDASAAPKLINSLIENNLDMVVGTRVEKIDAKNSNNPYRLGHRFGNRMFNIIISKFFGQKFNDVFSGYRIFSRRFVKSFPADAKGFDIETEMSIHCIEMRLPTLEIPTEYIGRPDGSESKLNKYRDGILILTRIFRLLKDIRPLLFYSSIFVLLLTISISIFIPVLIDYLNTGLVARFPTAILSTGLMLLGFMSLGCGLILDNVCKISKNINRMSYLAISNKTKENHSNLKLYRR